MNKLFIIGNGFDLAHGIPSTFNHFKEFLRCKYNYNPDEDVSLLLDWSDGYQGEEICDAKACAQIIDSLISDSCSNIGDRENWSDFEKAMGYIDYSLLDDEIEIVYDKEGDEHIGYTENNFEDAYSNLKNGMLKITDFLSEWISSISITESSYSVFNLDNYYNFLELIDKNNDTFLTFNYTQTLEELYEAKNVTHLHGNQESPVMGHNNDSKMGERNYHQEIYINSINEALRKPTSRIIESNRCFFEKLQGEIDSIYSYGFSFGEVDLIYIKEVLKHLDSGNIKWYLHRHDEIKHEEFKKKIKKCGFQGTFLEFD